VDEVEEIENFWVEETEKHCPEEDTKSIGLNRRLKCIGLNRRLVCVWLRLLELFGPIQELQIIVIV
jgi:hypothetical protein